MKLVQNMSTNSAETWNSRISGIERNGKARRMMISVGMEEEMGALIEGNGKTRFRNRKIYTIKGFRLRMYGCCSILSAGRTPISCVMPARIRSA